MASLKLKNIYKVYPSGVTAVTDFNLDIEDKEFIVFVGPSGCGKSTLIRLINGLCPHYFGGQLKGTVRVAGQNNQTLKLHEISNRVGTLFQNPESQFFALGVEEEMAFKPESRGMHPDKIRDLIAKTSQRFGLNSVLKNTIHELSQGQKQLISIARIMLKDPPMLILDEATSSIDIRTEQRIQRAFEKIMKGKTSFIIAHRLSTIKNADVILVMKDGSIIEQGTHDELIAQRGEYYKLYISPVSYTHLTLPTKRIV